MSDTFLRRVRITYHGLEWHVSGYYQPPQKQVLYEKNGDPGDPGSPADLIDAEIWILQDHSESDEMADILTQKAIDTIIDRALEAMEEEDRYGPDIPF